MSTKFHPSIIHPVGRLLAAGLVAATLCGRLQAQYVSTAISNNLSGPYGVAQDPADNVYVTDSGNDRILEYTPSTTNVSTLAGLSGVAGTNNGANASARFDGPVGIVYARGGLVVVDQSNQELRYVSLAGVVTNLAGVAGSPGLNDGAALGAEFSYPTGIAVDGGGNLYIADQGNNKIRKLDTNNMVTTIGADHSFYLPYAVAVDNNGNIWVTDTGNQQICMISNGVTYVEAGTHRVIGTNDTSLVNHTGPLFDLPKGLYWDSSSNILVISDTGNDTIRKLYWTNFQGMATNVVQTVTGIPGTAGFVDGSLGTAKFNQPYGICADTTDTGYYIVDSGNNAVRILQPTQPPPPPQPVTNPVIGYVTYPQVDGTPGAQFNPITSQISVFHNVVNFAIEQDDATVSTYMNYGAKGSVITSPSTNSLPVNAYTSDDNGLTPGNGGFVLNLNIVPDMILEAISVAPGRPSSSVVSAEIQFVTANPNIIGNDAADIILSNTTVGAEMFYVLDNSTNSPTNDGSYGIGPITTGQTLVLNITTNVNLKVRAFASGFSPSGTVTELLNVSNFIGNQLTFGFNGGEGSSEFATAAGRHFYAPVTLSVLPDTTMYSLQFNLSAISNNSAPALDLSTWQFDSFLRTPVTINGGTFLAAITNGVVVTNGGGYTVTNGQFTNIADNLMGVSWIEIYPETNLYDTLAQDLTEYSLAHDDEFLEANGKILVGAYSFLIPTNAAIDSTYTIQANLPSATTYFPPETAPEGVFIQAPTNGSLTIGDINSIKTVTVGTASYLVGDTYPFRWFNAGDFGDGNLQNDDVIEVFESAIYGFSTPPTNSDYYDAMDSSDGTVNDLYSSSDSAINQIKTGDGQLMVDDVYVTLLRSLNTNLTWWVRNWSNGSLTVTAYTNIPTYGVAPALSSPPPSQPSTNGPRSISVAADQVQSGGSYSVQVPVRVLAGDAVYPLRVLMLRVEVDPLDGSPALTAPITFSSAASLGSTFTSVSQGPNDYGAVWLNSTNAGISGAGLLGTLTVTLPSNVTSNSAYLVHFDHFSSSPNGLALFHATIQDGLITTRDRSGSSWGDGIPDSWRLLWFSSVSNSLSAANADPDGDGASNWQEYVAGTNPNDAASVFTFGPGSTFSPSSFTLQWPSVVNKHYSVQMSSSISPAKWTTLVTNLVGTGQAMQWQDNNATGKGQFYRALVQ